MSERVLVIAAHPDDEVLGCGGTIAKHAANGDFVHVMFLSDGETSRQQHNVEQRRKAAEAAIVALGGKLTPRFCDYVDQKLDTYPLLHITKSIEYQVSGFAPTIVYTHHAGDLNKDHRIVHEAVRTAIRPLPGISCKAIYGFEVLSSTEWGEPFKPIHFVDTTKYHDTKGKALRCYDKEMRPWPHPRSYASVDHLAMLRGATCGVHFAEAFTTIWTIA